MRNLNRHLSKFLLSEHDFSFQSISSTESACSTLLLLWQRSSWYHNPGRQSSMEVFHHPIHKMDMILYLALLLVDYHLLVISAPFSIVQPKLIASLKDQSKRKW